MSKIKILKKQRLYYYRSRKRNKLFRYIRDKERRRKKAVIKKIQKSTWNNSSFYQFLKRKSFIQNKKTRIKFNQDNEAIVKIPEIFSLAKNPEETIAVYNLLYQIAKNRNINKILIDHSNCKVLGLEASTVMDVFVINLEKHKKLQGKDVYIHGKLPDDPFLRIVLHVSGILKHLNISDQNIDELVEKTDGIEKLDLIKGGKHSGTLKVSTNIGSASASTLISDYFNKCLATQGYELSGDGYSLLCHMVGEVIDNCQIHSGEFCQWFTLGNYFIVNQVDEYGECNLVFFNFGQTIYEGLKDQFKDLDYTIRDKKLIDTKISLDKLTALHSQRGFFGPKWNEEVLWTLYALQDGVSRCISEDEPDRGTGTVRLIEAFQEIGNTVDGKEPEMCIISGKSQIKFSNKYRMKAEIKDGEKRQIIAFNDQNDLKIPPDTNFVRILDSYFPGTIISMKFYLDKSYIGNALKEEDPSEKDQLIKV